ncbi:hypothetical protein EBR43_08020 [bacterium]|nr:hypothetical protein [bacterium]
MRFEKILYKNYLVLNEEAFSSDRDCTQLSISPPNSKIPFYNLNLPAGYTCPFADKCLSKADVETGKIKEGEKGEDEYRCYAASQEAVYPAVRKQRHNNFDLLLSKKTADEMADLIVDSIQTQIPRREKIFRIHSSGDFYNMQYLQAWIKVAERMPDIKFYAYTKSIPYWVNLKDQIPGNLILTASLGSRHDDLIMQNNLKYSVVVFSQEQAENYVLPKYWQEKLGREKGLVIDHDDHMAYENNEPFALLIHGVQPKGTEAAAALKKLGGIGGKSSYSKKKR